MKLRQWQRQCVEYACQKFETNNHFLCLATPGAGKSVMSAELAHRLYAQGKIDFIICFAPSTEVALGLASTFERRFSMPFDGRLGAIGGAYTYQSMIFQSDDFWRMFRRHRVLVVFDEIHHAAGLTVEEANSWGRSILELVHQDADYTLTLTGTPWRSDGRGVSLSYYIGNRIQYDFSYGLADAVQDGVCRHPNMVLVDNDRLSINDETDGNKKHFTGIASLLKSTKASYRTLLHNTEALKYVLGLGVDKLDEIRKGNSAAGGLVVAASISHARHIVQILKNDFDQNAIMVTCKELKPVALIDDFRRSTQPWIVSVGMISEGTDIPRLQVCCNLSNVKTELYFRQVLGRILRTTAHCNKQAWLYTFAEPNLEQFAQRIAEELPEQNVVFREFIKVTATKTNAIKATPNLSPKHLAGAIDERTDLIAGKWSKDPSMAGTRYNEATMEFLGQFQQRLCLLNIATPDTST